MKFFALLAVALLSGQLVIAQGTQERIIPTTSAFWRAILPMEDQYATLAALGLASNGVPGMYVAFGPTGTLIATNPPSFTFSSPWAGPTNVIDLGTNTGALYLHYTTVTSMAITGFTNRGTGVLQNVVLEVASTASTNVTLYLPAGFQDLNYVSSYTLTNGCIFTGRYNPYLTRTNGLARVW